MSRRTGGSVPATSLPMSDFTPELILISLWEGRKSRLSGVDKSVPVSYWESILVQVVLIVGFVILLQIK